MRKSSLRSVCLLGPLFLVACGGGNASKPEAKSADGNTGEIRSLTQAQTSVAHYKSADGMYGLVLDRTGQKPKVQLDGQKDIVELTVREVRVTRSGQGPAGSLLGYQMLAPDGKQVLYVGVDGDVHYIHNGDDLYLNTDKKAEPLAAATVTGTAAEPVAEKSPADLVDAKLRPLAVRTKLTQYTTNDAADLTKLGAAFAALDAGSFVHFEAAKAHGAKFAPDPKNPTDAFDGEEAKAKAGMGKYNAKVFPILEPTDDDSSLKIAGIQLARHTEPPADKTPGVVWEIINHQAVFVTLDGGRYLVDISSSEGQPIAAGLLPPAQWPAPLHDSALGPPTVETLASLGQVPQKTADEASAAQTAWGTCARDAFKTLKPQLAAIDRENLSYSTKLARMKETRQKWETSTTTKCAPKAKTMETVLLSATEARNKARLDLFEKAKARAATMK